MKIVFSFAVLLLTSFVVNAQQIVVNGTVTDSENTPIAGANILIKYTNTGSQTNIDGQFKVEINPIDSGMYTAVVSYLGYKTKEVPFTVSNGNATLPAIVLYEGQEILSEVVIDGKRRNMFARKQTAYVSKLPLKDLENTQVYSTVTTDILESQIATNFEDALDNATGIQQLWTSTGRGGDGAGYYSLRGFSVQPQLVNGVPGLTNGTINAANIERIEVIKGPSATLFGSSVTSYGGLINVVTKKPYEGSGGQLSYTAGSYGLNILTGDFNTALDANEDLYFRLNTSYHTEDSFQDAGFKKSFFVAPSLSYRVNNRLSFSFYGEISQSEKTNPTMLFLSRAGAMQYEDLDDLGYDYKKSYTSNALTLENPTQNYRVEMDYKLSDAWSSQTIVSRSVTSTKGYYTYLYDLTGAGTFSRYLNKQDALTRTTDIQQNFNGDFKIGNLRNRIVAGLDYYTETSIDNGSSYAYYGSVTPSTGEEAEGYPLTTAGVDAALASASINNYKTRTSVYSAYVSDVLDITSKLSAMASIRFDQFDNEGDITTNSDDYDQFAVSPKFGLLYQPIEGKLSVFANWQNGFTNIAPQLVGDPSSTDGQELKNFEAEQANQIEFGIKTNFFNNRLNATINYYDILVSNRLMTDPDDTFGLVQDGEVSSKGFELEINANPVNGLNVRAGFSYNDSEIEKASTASTVGERPVDAGSDIVYNLWADYIFETGTLKGFGIGAGFNGASERDIINASGYTSGVFSVPSYIVANASVYYAADRYRVGLKLNNMFNEEYYSGWSTLTPQQPRAVLANFAYKF
ncbi:TonB-dependent receptor [Formosa algae]|uniref:Iron complex outermembrane receptor protein n=1 Tax=Formosa algae TaxID=225843 RepID=A0A9X1C930_9FLAO|nr:TonB-dependent receptor [Formosa algae]MBP1839508.1 iron complex outermembrane receptor protein [Formosa algae]MDQ0334812.1 iron complex outermembrane receptor protein [Formosa algae]OEI82056.1 TonB-dependent receptor [Formosa algae]